MKTDNLGNCVECGRLVVPDENDVTKALLTLSNAGWSSISVDGSSVYVNQGSDISETIRKCWEFAFSVNIIPDDTALIVITVANNNWVYADSLIKEFNKSIGETSMKRFKNRILVVPDTVTIEALSEFGILEKLAKLSPDIAKELARCK